MQDSITTPEAVNEDTVSADFFTRLVAIIIDVIIVGIPSVILNYILPFPIGWILGLVIGVGYYVYFWTNSGQTPGKMAMGLKVVSSETGGLLEVQGAVIRYVCYIVSAIPLYLGFLWALWDPKHDTWHDKLAKTKVIKVK